MARVFLELAVAGDRRAVIEPGMLGGLITSGPDLSETASKDRPLRLLMRAGETIDVIGISAHLLLAKMDRASVNNKKGMYDTVTLDGQSFQRDTVVIWLDEDDGKSPG